MQIEGSVAFVTGSNKPDGIGRAIVETLIDAGAKKVYAAARDIRPLFPITKHYRDALIPLELDITNTEQMTKAASIADDTNILINNAGVARFVGLVAAHHLADARVEMEVNYFGTLSLVRTFAPVLKANGGGAIINISSIAGLVNMPFVGSYSVSKAAVHSMTQGVRAELSVQKTKVIGVYPGPVDTEMVSNLDMPKAPPAHVARTVVAAIEAGTEDVFPDEMAREVQMGLSQEAKAIEKRFAAMLPTT